LILINTWNLAVSFRRYFDQSTLCATVPPVSDLRTQRVDLVRDQMLSAAPMTPVLQKMEETLRAGHSVWLIGALPAVRRGNTPLTQPPPSDMRIGAGGFFRSWAEQAAFLVQLHADEWVLAPVSAGPVVQYEDVPLSVIHGWHESRDLSLR
jgi:hypothetical protein